MLNSLVITFIIRSFFYIFVSLLLKNFFSTNMSILKSQWFLCDSYNHCVSSNYFDLKIVMGGRNNDVRIRLLLTMCRYVNAYFQLVKSPNVTITMTQHSLERAAAGIGLHVNAHKTEFMCFNLKGDISTLDGTSLKLVDKFTYLGSSVSSTKKDIDTRQTKAWAAIERLSIIRKSNLSDKRKRSFFQAAVVSILLYGCTTWTQTKRLEKKLDGNVESNIEQVLTATPHKAPTIRSSTTYHENYPS